MNPTEPLHKALQKAVTQFGSNILEESRLVNILLDLGAFSEVPSSKYVLREMISENCSKKIIRIGSNKSLLKGFATTMASQSGFNYELVEYTTFCISYSLDLTCEEPVYITTSFQAPAQGKPQGEVLKGEYSENLPTGGELKITAQSWRISYYFPGPDLRHNGTFHTIASKDIDAYIEAWKDNFDKYLQLKQLLPPGGNSDYAGKMGMSIRFGWAEGVCLTSYHMPIRTKEKLDQVVNDYQTAKVKATKIQQILKGI